MTKHHRFTTKSIKHVDIWNFEKRYKTGGIFKYIILRVSSLFSFGLFSNLFCFLNFLITWSLMRLISTVIKVWLNFKIIYSMSLRRDEELFLAFNIPTDPSNEARGCHFLCLLHLRRGCTFSGFFLFTPRTHKFDSQI